MFGVPSRVKGNATETVRHPLPDSPRRHHDRPFPNRLACRILDIERHNRRAVPEPPRFRELPGVVDHPVAAAKAGKILVSVTSPFEVARRMQWAMVRVSW